MRLPRHSASKQTGQLSPALRAAISYRMLTTSTINANSSSNTKNPGGIACLIIGDEVLGGKTVDTNSSFLAKLCFNNGLSLNRIVVVPDETDQIVAAVRQLHTEFDHVITTGGIGPTHDDITYESIANAFNLTLQHHEPTIALMQKLGIPQPFIMNAGRLRMANLPHPATITFPNPDSLWVPVVTAAHSVHIFPGIPRLFERMIVPFLETNIVPSTPVTGGAFIRRVVGTDKPESEIEHILRRWQADLNAKVAAQQTNVASPIKIGSYPKFGGNERVIDIADGAHRAIKVVVSIVGKDVPEVERVACGIRDEISGFDFREIVIAE
ncbi:hypothetical protein HK100_002666 [Physocladia obscura]|uniref:MoaB/Mog domain-containing protein n=1 Tax=Physocladia obscura TaxID=109957 RepID=A0AAD5XE31_9FUNG|nr:hypothetical protein HK100_002666 [Physocladia obscura]